MARKKPDTDPIEAGLVRIRNTSPRGALDVPLLGNRTVDRGATVDVLPAHAQILLRQEVWELVDDNGSLTVDVEEVDLGEDEAVPDEPAPGEDGVTELQSIDEDGDVPASDNNGTEE
jgi:hypothetical protein